MWKRGRCHDGREEDTEIKGRENDGKEGRSHGRGGRKGTRIWNGGQEGNNRWGLRGKGLTFFKMCTSTSMNLINSLHVNVPPETAESYGGCCTNKVAPTMMSSK